MKINHIAIVDFNEFKKLIDEIGGITIDVPKPIQSNRFDCPFSAAQCRNWKGWRFGKGKQHMDGQRALIYTRIRENQLDPGENDLTRSARQQQVIQAVSSKLAGVGTFLDLPFIGGDLMKPLSTDLSAGDFIQLGWVRYRSGSGGSVHCRLGGDPEYVDGKAVLVPERGQPRRDLDVHGRVGAAAAAPGLERVRAGLRDRQQALPELARRLRVGGLRALLGRLFGRLRAVAVGLAAVAARRLDLALAAPVVGRVEARSLEEDRHRAEDSLDGLRTADLARLRRRIVHAMQDLEFVAFRDSGTRRSASRQG